jgi:hypothetical protein
MTRQLLVVLLLTASAIASQEECQSTLDKYEAQWSATHSFPTAECTAYFSLPQPRPSSEAISCIRSFWGDPRICRLTPAVVAHEYQYHVEHDGVFPLTFTSWFTSDHHMLSDLYTMQKCAQCW